MGQIPRKFPTPNSTVDMIDASSIFPTSHLYSCDTLRLDNYARSTYSNMGGLDQGLRSRYFSSSVTLAAFQSFRNKSTGLRHLSCTIIIPNNFPSASAFSTASHPPSAHRASVYAIGSNSLSTLYSDFRRAWLEILNNDLVARGISWRNIIHYQIITYTTSNCS